MGSEYLKTRNHHHPVVRASKVFGSAKVEAGKIPRKWGFEQSLEQTQAEVARETLNRSS
jgi:hypothetical protein